MPLVLKQSVKEDGEVKEALRRRVNDDELKKFSDRELDQKITELLISGGRQEKLTLVPGGPAFSHTWRNFIQDEKFFVGSLNGRTSRLEEDIENTARESFGVLQEIQQEVLSLDSFITEEEIKTVKNYSKVHYNSFVRSIDQGLGFNDLSWTVDFKTELPFLPNNKGNVIEGTGLTLPLKESTRVPISNVELVGEGTDMGDSRQPIISTSPRNTMLPNKIFRHVIIKRDFDDSGRTYKRSYSEISLLLTLANLQLINNMTIRPIGQSLIEVSGISYLNEAGEEVDLALDVIKAETNLVVLFEAIRTKYLRITMRQHGAVASTKYNVKDESVKQINGVLKGVGFKQYLDEKDEEIQGRVYDFSLEGIELGLHVYESLGVFRSKSVEVRSPLGLTITDKSDKITVTRTEGDYKVDLSLPEGAVLNEYYVGARLQDVNQNVLLEDLIPIPDSYPVQREYLPLVGGLGKLKLFPNLQWNLDKIVVKSVEALGSVLTITTTNDHEQMGDVVVEAVSPLGHPLNGSFKASVVDANTLKIIVADASSYVVTENDLPVTFLFVGNDQIDPLTVSREGTSLEIGQDYTISLDGGQTFNSSWPRGSVYREALRLARSGRCIIKIINPELEKIYWVQYRPNSTQYLGKTNLVQLKNGRVIFDASLKNTTGSLHTVIVSRADSNSPYITPIVQFYALKVRENVS